MTNKIDDTPHSGYMNVAAGVTEGEYADYTYIAVYASSDHQPNSPIHMHVRVKQQSKETTACQQVRQEIDDTHASKYAYLELMAYAHDLLDDLKNGLPLHPECDVDQDDIKVINKILEAMKKVKQ